jgi:hypothetical protein
VILVLGLDRSMEAMPEVAHDPFMEVGPIDLFGGQVNHFARCSNRRARLLKRHHGENHVVAAGPTWIQLRRMLVTIAPRRRIPTCGEDNPSRLKCWLNPFTQLSGQMLGGGN